MPRTHKRFSPELLPYSSWRRMRARGSKPWGPAERRAFGGAQPALYVDEADPGLHGHKARNCKVSRAVNANGLCPFPCESATRMSRSLPPPGADLRCGQFSRSPHEPAIPEIPSNSAADFRPFDPLSQPEPHSAKTYGNPVCGTECRKTDEFPVPVTAALIGRFSAWREIV